MTVKNITYSSDARQKLAEGCSAIVDVVKTTLGPKGRSVALERSYGGAHVTKDGVSVAKEIELKDPVQNVAVQMIKEVANKTADVAGDGTTTATVLAGSMIRTGFKFVESGMNPMDLKRGMELATNAVLEHLQNVSQPITGEEEIKQIATISANNDINIGTKIAEAIQTIGKDGVISVEEARSLETTVETVSGMKFDRGYLSPYFVTNSEKMKVEFDNPLILITDNKISQIKTLLPVLEGIMKQGRSLLIIAEDIDTDALSTLVVNRIRGGLKICAVKAPAFGDNRRDILQDIAILTGGTVISNEVGLTLDKVEDGHLGNAKKIIVDKDNTLIVDANGDDSAVKHRADEIKNHMLNTSSAYDKEKLNERVASLIGGAAVIKVGGFTEVEIKEIKDRVDDAVAATRSAIEEGIVSGGGTALVRSIKVVSKLSSDNPDILAGIKIIETALKEPLIQIVANSGANGEFVVQKLLSDNIEDSQGYNAQSAEYTDMIKAGIIDPTKVVRTALQNANSVAGIMITMEAVVVDDPDEKGETSAMTPPMGGGMGF
ncbi:MAG: chaperonin GroEL [Alphaproteobacteria bacterium]|nr:chaperonin GroEL [Alphaproteobacteria bacterium]MBL0717665.1 chaperonin GroEL [Alphaproteobacteria bacterium]